MTAAVLRPQLRMPLRLLLSALVLAACGIGQCTCTRVDVRERLLAGGRRKNAEQILLGRVGEFETQLIDEQSDGSGSSSGRGSGAPAALALEDSRLDVLVTTGTIEDFLPKHEASVCNGRRLFIYPNLPPIYDRLPLEMCSRWEYCRWPIDRDGLGSLLPHLPTNGDGSGSGNSSGGDVLKASVFEHNVWLQSLSEGLGILFHARAQRYDCLVSDWKDADAVNVPLLLDVVWWLTGNRPTDKVAVALADFLERQPAFHRHGGVDHFIVVGTPLWDYSRGPPLEEGGWGSNVTFVPGLERLTYVSVEAMSWRPNTVSFPYITGFHPVTTEEMVSWQRFVAESTRPYLVALSCATRDFGRAKVIREPLISLCLSRPDQCRYLNCSSDCPLGSCMGGKGCSDPRVVAHVFLSARFCLQPPGDTSTRRSTFDAIVAGCIPVTFNPEALQKQYPFHLPGNKSEYSVLFDEKEVEAGRLNVVDELAKISEEEVATMRKRAIELMPNVVYRDHRRSNPASILIKDAFDIGLEGVFRHLKDRVEMK